MRALRPPQHGLIPQSDKFSRSIPPGNRASLVLSAPNSIEGAIGHAEARALSAEARLRELASQPHSSLLEAYRANKTTPDLFGTGRWDRERNTVAVATSNGQLFFGTNSNAPTYSGRDRAEASRTVDGMLQQFPKFMNRYNIGGEPNNALYHAEATVLLRMRELVRGDPRWSHVRCDR